MTPLRVSATIDGDQPNLVQKVAGALFIMAATKSGSSVSDLEIGHLALTELIEAIQEVSSISELVLHGSATAFELSLKFEAASAPALGEGSRQIIETAFTGLSISTGCATMTIRAARIDSDND